MLSQYSTSTSPQATAEPFQFSLRTLLLATAAVGYFLGLITYLGRGVFLLLPISAVICLGVRYRERRRRFFVRAALLHILLAAGGAYCATCWYTHTEEDYHMCWIVLFIAAIPPAVLCAVGQFKAVDIAAILVTIPLACCLPEQAHHMHRFTRIKREVPLIAGWLESRKTEVGRYPDDLSGYSYRDQELAPYIWYWPYIGYWPDALQRRRYIFTFTVRECRHEYRMPGGWMYYPQGWFYESDEPP